jgi:hypothetical protein
MGEYNRNSLDNVTSPARVRFGTETMHYMLDGVTFRRGGGDEGGDLAVIENSPYNNNPSTSAIALDGLRMTGAALRDARSVEQITS